MMKQQLSRGLRLLMAMALATNIGFIGSLPAQAAEGSNLNLSFYNHIQLGFPEQDVFLMRNDLPADQVMRVEDGAAKEPANLAMTLYASAAVQSHDPLKLGSNPLGPFPKGSALGFTLKQWLAAKGSGSYHADGENSELNLSFHKLVPNATYTLWCSHINLPPNFSVLDIPCGATDGSQNVLHSNANGDAMFHLKLNALSWSTDTMKSAMALAYHSDGKSHGTSAGDFGLNSHVQIVTFLPKAQAPCIQDAIQKRDSVIIPAFDVYHDSTKSALMSRRDTLNTAWGMSDAGMRKNAINSAWDAFRVRWHKAWNSFRADKKNAWKEFRMDRKACGNHDTSEDIRGEGVDSQL